MFSLFRGLSTLHPSPPKVHVDKLLGSKEIYGSQIEDSPLLSLLLVVSCGGQLTPPPW